MFTNQHREALSKKLYEEPLRPPQNLSPSLPPPKPASIHSIAFTADKTRSENEPPAKIASTFLLRGRLHILALPLGAAELHMASSCTIKLVGPDLPVDGLKCVIELTGNIGQLRASAYAQLPPPTGQPLQTASLSVPRARRVRASGLINRCLLLAGGATPPRLEQVRVIHQGRFLPDEKLIKGDLRKRWLMWPRRPLGPPRAALSTPCLGISEALLVSAFCASAHEGMPLDATSLCACCRVQSGRGGDNGNAPCHQKRGGEETP